jgi:hypothetical protein
MKAVLAVIEESNSLSLVLSIVGAVSGLAGITINLLTYQRNRPRLRIEAMPVYDGKGGRFELAVRNEGLQPVDIISIGFAYSNYSGNFGNRIITKVLLFPVQLRHKHNRQRYEMKYNELAAIMDEDENIVDEVVHLTPGVREVITVPMETVNDRFVSGQYAWPYAEDFAGRIAYASRPVFAP